MRPDLLFMEIAGYIAAALIGIFLGLIGGGGSILTIPVLVYLFHIQPSVATGYSLFIVGVSSLAGAWKHYRWGNTNLKAAFYFGIPSILTVLLIRKFLLPTIPEHLFTIDGHVVTKSLATMVLFAAIMIFAGWQMIRKETIPFNGQAPPTILFGKALIRGIETGIITGLLGAGGGFVILPVLVFSFHLSMKQAIGTSLLIIAMNTLSGFAGDLSHQQFDWSLLLPVAAIAITGTFVGRKIGEKVPGEKLKKGFGWFVLLMGGMIIMYELVLN